jgi:isopropylmalate/homocitrate/citramalate synthase
MRVENNPDEFDWSKFDGGYNLPVRNPVANVQIDDETLRDGLQGTQLDTHPTTEGKKFYLASMAHNGFIEHADIGFPGSEELHKEELKEIMRFAIESNLPTTLSTAARGASGEDVRAIIDLSKNFDGYPLEADVFLDGSSYRAKVQNWDRDEKLQGLKDNIKLLKQNGLPVMFVPERATSTSPEELLETCRIAADLGADRICIADTVGVANESAIRNIFRFSFDKLGREYPELKWDAHFHNDRNLAMANCLTAAEEGVDRVHATMFCIGERSGNVDILQLLLNLNLEGFRDDDLTKMKEVANIASKILKYEPAENSAVYGDNAFGTSSGVHASGKSIYHLVSPDLIGQKSKTEIGPFSGRANVEAKLCELGIESTSEIVDSILHEAKQSRGLLSSTTNMGIAHPFFPRKS